MNFNAEQTSAWSPSCMDRIRAELIRGYQRMEQVLTETSEDGAVLSRTMLSGAQRAVEEAQPTWMSSRTVRSLSETTASPVPTDALIADGHHGFLLFEQPLTHTTLGDAAPSGIAPMDGILWWAAEFDGHGFHHDSDHPDLVVAHALSTRVSTDMPWQPSVWEDSELTDLGMFPLPLGMEMTPPTSEQDDLAPAIGLLLAYGQAIDAGRILFADAPGSARRPSPREVAVVYTPDHIETH